MKITDETWYADGDAVWLKQPDESDVDDIQVGEFGVWDVEEPTDAMFAAAKGRAELAARAPTLVRENAALLVRVEHLASEVGRLRTLLAAADPEKYARDRKLVAEAGERFIANNRGVLAALEDTPRDKRFADAQAWVLKHHAPTFEKLAQAEAKDTWKGLRPIRTEAEHRRALARINDELCDAKEGTPEHDELEALAILVDAYEEEHHPIAPLPPVLPSNGCACSACDDLLARQETKRCPVCPGTMRRDNRDATLVNAKGEVVTFDQPGWYCDRCSETLLEPVDSDVTEAEWKPTR